MSNEIATTRDSTLQVLFDDSGFDKAWRIAQLMSDMRVNIPRFLQGKPHDCMAVVLQAHRWNMDPFAIAAKCYQVKDGGMIAYEAQLVNAVVQNSGAIVGPFRYEWRNESADVECRVGAVLRGDTDITWTPWLKNSQVTTRNSPNWKTNPGQQLGYVQVRNFARLYAPGAILGVYADEEFESAKPVDRPVNVTESVVNEKPALPPWPDESFEARKEQYKDLMLNKGKTAKNIITSLSSKFTLSEAQKQAIRDLLIIDAVIEEQQENPVLAALEQSIADALSVDDVLETVAFASDYVQSKAITAAEFAAIQKQAESKKEELLA